MKRIVAMMLALAAAVPVPARAHDPESIALGRVRAACAAAQHDCATAEAAVAIAFAAMQRTGGGVSYGDARNENEHHDIVVDVGSFYFAPRILEVDPDQVVRFVNTSPAAGNRHIVSSSDWLAFGGGAFPIPGSLSFGGGAVSSGILQPGETWEWAMDPGAHPESGIPLGVDKVLIPYHCNLHGSAQMNGYLILRTREY